MTSEQKKHLTELLATWNNYAKMMAPQGQPVTADNLEWAEHSSNVITYMWNIIKEQENELQKLKDIGR